MKTHLEPVEYTLPAYWASYLINGDDSGISDEDKKQADEFLQSNKLPAPVSCSDESYFSWRNDATNLGGDVMEFSFLLPVELPKVMSQAEKDVLNLMVQDWKKTFGNK